jgi:hypothetical protein
VSDVWVVHNGKNERASWMPISDEDKKHYVEIWKKAVETQMHFNEMSVKSRQFGLAFVAAALGVGIVLLSRGNDFAIPVAIFGVKFYIHITVLITLAAALGLSAVRILDLHVYHKMLRGAVTFGEDFEQNYMKKIFDLDKGMTQAISHYSRFDDAAIEEVDGKYRYRGSTHVTAEEKVRQFYRYAIWTLIISSGFLFVVTVNLSRQ